MSAELETMFYVGEMPWHGLGTRAEEILSSQEVKGYLFIAFK